MQTGSKTQLTGRNLSQFDIITKQITVDSKQLTSLLNYAFNLGHQGMHHFDTIFNASSMLDVLGRGPLGLEARRFFWRVSGI